MCVAMKNIAPDAANRCLKRLLTVASSINFFGPDRVHLVPRQSQNLFC